MELQDYLKTLRRQWVVVVATTAALLLLAGLYVATATPIYSARTELFVAAESSAGTPQEQLEASDFSQDRVKSYVQVVDSELVLQPVIDELELDTSVESLAGKVSATVPTDTVIIAVRVSDASPQQAATIADAVAASFKTAAAQLEDPETSNTTVTITVVQSAVEPRRAVAPNKKLIIGLGLLLGLSIGFAIAVFRDLLDKRVRRESDVTAVTDLPVIGRIPLEDDSRTPAVLAGDAMHGVRAEAFRQLRTNLQFVKVDRDTRSYVVTSSRQGEGKTTTAINLALTLADAGMKVCLVDADLRQPGTADYLDLKGEVGLAELLIGVVPLIDALQPWRTTGLDVLTAGSLPPNPSELLGSQAMQELLIELEQRYDHVVIDSPPLLAVTDAAILATHAAGVLVVVSLDMRGVVTRPQLSRTLEDLASVQAPVLGIVINRMPTKGPDSIAVSTYTSYRAHEQQAP
ncbi:MAG: polysaccharide biosynthesis tyrosine autokinase [Ilumatobacteraceae bacterium]